MVKREFIGEEGHQEWKPMPKQPAKPTAGVPSKRELNNDLPLLSPFIRTLSDRTIFNIQNECPGQDIYALQAAFNEWLDADVSRTPNDYEAAFRGWIRKHNARNLSQPA